MIKGSILLFYRRIFPTRNFKTAVHIVGTFLVCWFLSVLVVCIFGCIPISASWDRTILGARCINQNRFFLANSILNISGDLIILCMPMPIIWTLQLARSKKIALTAVFLLGSFALAGSIVRAVYLMRALHGGPDILCK